MIIAEEKKMFKTTGTEIFEILYFLFLNIHFGGVGQKDPVSNDIDFELKTVLRIVKYKHVI
jgi:hypothetical protein